MMMFSIVFGVVFMFFANGGCFGFGGRIGKTNCVVASISKDVRIGKTDFDVFPQFILFLPIFLGLAISGS